MSSAADFQISKIFDLRDRIALVSGGGTGIGLMIAEGLAANGAKVYIGGRRKDVLQLVADRWAASGKGTILPYVKSIIETAYALLSQTFVVQMVVSLSTSQKEIASSVPKNILKKRREDYTSS
jgi:NAD(P)-dependent dehydrogenase (short-subunit alcohol dehydrogenase family)